MDGSVSVSGASASPSFGSGPSGSLASSSGTGAIASGSEPTTPPSARSSVPEATSLPDVSAVEGTELGSAGDTGLTVGVTLGIVEVGTTPPASALSSRLPSAHDAPAKPKSTNPRCAAFTEATLAPPP